MKAKTIEIIARAVIVRDGALLLCKQKTKKYYFLPGGHVEFGESSENALKREIKEELGASVSSLKLIGIVENRFGVGKGKRHEINFVYSARLGAANVKSVEDHIEFFWKDIRSLVKENLKPPPLKKKLLRWLKDVKNF
ncbi:hypothetical protein A3C91_00820 [Candidatus Azambacteria bacterium RIFCSPHIGHO2_02_FULL_52_12]|uniref:Nudix hydrolase domain-containing protein n=1 Tax=Candidatus Azambacteria bacterium RIFCSPLOWO2_01_FULL_46_25 TaxID=1797298 RepID=A0A1F5BU01_9BACT|nr:MAG: hypothetical protein A3C91_00820 [Candidatus Azambacteria bacterium RIFCSPHIGHO2_02_FULL_52_12]OGD34066.1 MAG: hypothetical protein A2988_01100 [Candidatus Azambacteria bacterium RIFCSPLOWO2_01_FULL_46_25]OGD37817.1 MAG: hypothetical protein A2850_04440 [Candidatus Azambacteria bacterium RIFCSPHIGHO2_01_FULL_51_74]